jgi:hypothetical protein
MANNSEEGQGSQRAVVPVMMMMMIICSCSQGDNEINNNKHCTIKPAGSLFPIIIIAQSMLWVYQSGSGRFRSMRKAVH